MALLPGDKIERAFNELAVEALKLSETFTPFVIYFRNQWLRRVGPKNFSVFLEETRTTCGAEGYNGKLGKTFQTHSNFLVFIESLQWEELAKSNALEQHINGARQTQPKKKYRERSDLIRNESIKFTIPNKTNPQLFVNRIANIRNRMLPEQYERFENIIEYDNENEEILDLMNTTAHSEQANSKVHAEPQIKSATHSKIVQTSASEASDAKIPTSTTKTIRSKKGKILGNASEDSDARIATSVAKVTRSKKGQSKIQTDISLGVKTRNQSKKLLESL